MLRDDHRSSLSLLSKTVGELSTAVDASNKKSQAAAVAAAAAAAALPSSPPPPFTPPPSPPHAQPQEQQRQQQLSSPPPPPQPPWSPGGGHDTMMHFCWKHQDYGLINAWRAVAPTHHCSSPTTPSQIPTKDRTAFDCRGPPNPQRNVLPQMPNLCELTNVGVKHARQLLHSPGCALNHHPLLQQGLSPTPATSPLPWSGGDFDGGSVQVVDAPVFLIDADRVRATTGHFNLFHKMDDILNAFLAVRVAGITSPQREKMQVLTTGGRGGGGRVSDEMNPLVVMMRFALSASQHIETFGDSVAAGGKPDGTVLYRRVILHGHWPGSMGLVWRGSACHHSAFFRDFGQLVLGGMGLLSPPTEVPAPTHPVLLFLVRRRKPSRNVGRIFANENEIFAMLSAAGTGVSTVRSDMSRLPFKDQVELARRSNILVGAHGAGLMHALFLADEAVVVEIFPPFRRDQHFRNIVRLAGKIYIPYHAERVTCVAKSSNIHVDVNDLKVVVDGAVRIARSFAPSKVHDPVGARDDPGPMRCNSLSLSLSLSHTHKHTHWDATHTHCRVQIHVHLYLSKPH